MEIFVKLEGANDRCEAGAVEEAMKTQEPLKEGEAQTAPTWGDTMQNRCNETANISSRYSTVAVNSFGLWLLRSYYQWGCLYGPLPVTPEVNRVSSSVPARSCQLLSNEGCNITWENLTKSPPELHLAKCIGLARDFCMRLDRGANVFGCLSRTCLDRP